IRDYRGGLQSCGTECPGLGSQRERTGIRCHKREGEMADNDEVVLGKINAAVAEHNAAERAVTTAQAELVSKSKVLGQLLLEVKKRHPKAADFEAFQKRVNGLGRSRAYDLLRLAGGRTTDEELRKDARERVRKHRAKKKLPTPEPVSVTDSDVTESSKRIT